MSTLEETNVQTNKFMYYTVAESSVQISNLISFQWKKKASIFISWKLMHKDDSFPMGQNVPTFYCIES